MEPGLANDLDDVRLPGKDASSEQEDREEDVHKLNHSAVLRQICVLGFDSSDEPSSGELRRISQAVDALHKQRRGFDSHNRVVWLQRLLHRDYESH